jgi:hypothetical protein
MEGRLWSSTARQLFRWRPFCPTAVAPAPEARAQAQRRIVAVKLASKSNPGARRQLQGIGDMVMRGPSGETNEEALPAALAGARAASSPG